MDDLAFRLQDIRARIAEAAACSGRPASAVRLLAVSKTQPAAAIAAAAADGQRAFGESRVPEALAKMDALHDARLEWHFLGALQRNKARLIAGRFHWLHSLESLAGAEALSRHLSACQATLRVLIEINVTGAPSRHGLAPEALFSFLEAYTRRSWPGLTLCGLMAMGPQGAPAGEIRDAFARVRELAWAARDTFGLPGFEELSMGMSADFELAIAEGATIVRVGQALFGGRP